MLFALVYLLLRRLVRLTTGSCNEQLDTEVELIVLRHQLRVLKRRAGRPRLRRRDRLSWPPSQYLADWDVHRARIFGRCEEHTGIEPLDRLVAQIVSTEPYVSARRVFFIVDNGSTHRGQASVDRLEGR